MFAVYLPTPCHWHVCMCVTLITIVINIMMSSSVHARAGSSTTGRAAWTRCTASSSKATSTSHAGRAATVTRSDRDAHWFAAGWPAHSETCMCVQIKRCHRAAGWPCTCEEAHVGLATQLQLNKI